MLFLPHKYQNVATQFILDTPKCALYLEMGLGKTVATLTAIDKLFDQCEIRKVLVISTLRVINIVWPTEIAKWNHTRYLTYEVIHGNINKRIRSLKNPAQIHLINYENLCWLVEQCGQRWPYDMVVLDESSKMKSPSAKRFRAFRKVTKFIDRIVELTGTPAPNGLLDLWAPTYLLDKGIRLGRGITAYKRRWFDTDYMGYTWTPKPCAKREIYQRLKDITVSMKTKDYLSLPEVITTNLRINMPKQLFKQYRQLEKEMVLKLKHSEISAANAAVLSNKCLQYANGAIYDEQKNWETIHNLKLDALTDIVEETAGVPLLVSYTYQSDLIRLQRKFPEACTLNSDSVIAKWNLGKVPMLLAHPASVGHGLNLQNGGNHLVWFGMNWSLELYQQMKARLHRQGQKLPVFIYHILMANTIDELILERLKSKRNIQEILMQVMKVTVY